MRVLLTRPAPELPALAQAVGDAGHEPVLQPALSIEPLAFSHHPVMDIDRFDCVIVTSRPAARALVDQIDDYWPQLPLGLKALAVGEGTAELLRGADIDTAVATPASSDGVVVHPWFAAASKVLLVTGEGGRGHIDAALEAAGQEYTRLDTYRRARVRLSAAQRAGLLESPIDLAWVTSADALAAMADWDLPSAYIRQVWVPSERVAASPAANHFSSVRSIGAADNASLLAELRKESV